jgi:hypothetical protein
MDVRDTPAVNVESVGAIAIQQYGGERGSRGGLYQPCRANAGDQGYCTLNGGASYRFGIEAYPQPFERDEDMVDINFNS